ncbi:hypothetical protein Tco_0340738 [Tanacetum coccineum]
MLLDSIHNGPFQFREITILAPKTIAAITRMQQLTDLTTKEKTRRRCDIKATNIILLSLPSDIYTIPEWSRFVTAAKQAKNLHDISYAQLYEYLKQNKNDANEVRTMQQIFPDPLDLIANTYNPPPSYSRLLVSSFLPTDNLIASLNKAMMFLSTSFNSRLPPTNNQLKTSCNLRTQATIQDGRVTVQNVQRRQSQSYGVNTRKGKTTGIGAIYTVGDLKSNTPRVIRCYNCKGECHIAK